MALKVWLPLDGDLRNLGASNVEVTNNGATINNSGKIGKCYEFDGTDDYLSFTANNFIQPTSHWSVTAWINLVSGKSYYPLFHFGTSTPNTSGISGFSLHGSYCNRLEGGDGSHVIDTTVYGTGFAYDKWLHVSLTYDKNKLNYYLNGDLMTTIDWDYGFGTQSNISIGKFWGPNLTGRLNDFRIYDHCLSAAEVHEIAMGLILHYKLNQNLGLTDIITGQDTYNVYNNYGVSASITNLSETYQGHIVRREVMTPTSANVSNFQTALYSHGVYGHRQTFLANTKYVFWIYYRPVSHIDIRVGGTASNIGGWTEIPPQSVGGGWYRVGQYRNGSVTSDKTDNIFTSFYTPTAVADTPITIDWAAPHLLAGTTEIPDNDWFDDTEVIDSSGYGHNGTITGNVTTSSSTPRYNVSTNFPDSACSIGIGNLSTMIPEGIFTFNIWFKKITNEWSSKNYETILGGPGGFELEAKVGGTNSPVLKYYSWGGGTTNYTLDEWHMITMVRTTTNTQFYLDGELKVTGSAGSIPSGDYFIGAWKTATAQNYRGYLSDARIYCTPLLDNDIKMLYNIGMKVDNLGGVHTFEINENGSNKLTKTGIMKNYMVEPFITLSDGSKWQLLLYHWVNNGTNLFTSSNAGFNNGFGLYSRLNYIDNFKYDNKYEFYVLQDGVAHRWTQTNAPLTTTSVTDFTTISGSPGGGICKCNGNTLLAKTGTTSNWWNACGCWTIYNGGIPGFGSSVICKQYLALYARISEPKLHIANLNTYATNFIEI